MAATATITCPECHKTFKGKVELDGKRVRCPRCEHPFLVQMGETLKVDRGAAEEEPAARPPLKKVRTVPPPVETSAAPPPDEPDGPAAEQPAAAAEAPAAATATAAPPPPKTAAEELDELFGEDNPNPYGVTTIDLRPRCPNCANPMPNDEAVVCLHCGYNTTTRQAVRTKKTIETSRQDLLTWLMPGLLALGGVLLVVLLCLFYSIGMPSMMGESFLVHESVRMWVTIIGLAIIWPLGRMALNRLVFNPVPPEIVKEEK